MRLFLVLISFVFSVSAFSQLNFDYQEGKFLIKGKVIDMQTNRPIAKAAIVIPKLKKGIVTDEEGVFSLYVYPDDIIKFSCMGYLAKEVSIKDIPEKDRYSMQIELIKDFYPLKEVNIYPWRTKEEFAKAFIEGDGIEKPILINGVAAPKYLHKEKSKITNPISTIYDKIKAKRRAANPDFKP